MLRLLGAVMLGLAVALFAGSGAAAEPPIAAGPNGAIEEVIDRELAASGVPGVAYAVAERGEISAAGARGVVRAGADAAVTPDSAFRCGSVSKSFTALAVMQLVEAGKIDLDAGLATYLTEFTGRPAAMITVRQLLTHTSGYSTFQGNESHSDDEVGEDALARSVAGLVDLDPASAPGKRWEYSNTNYQLLGRIIEVVSGRSFQQYVGNAILGPIGMDHGFVDDGEVHDDTAVGHTPWFGTMRPVADHTTHRATGPQGGIVASAADLALYLQTMMNGQDDVLSAEGKALMLQPAGGASPFYGFGWFVDPSAGTVWHSGSTPGFESLATMVPREQKAVVVLVNGGTGLGFGETAGLRDAITAAALGLDRADGDSRWSQKALFTGLVLLPIGYLLAMTWAWWRRDGIRAKSGVSGLFSLWFPLLTTAVAAWVMLGLVPRLVGAPLRTIALFQPDLGVLLLAGAVTGVLWAGFRLAVAYPVRSLSTSGRHRRQGAGRANRAR